MTEEKSAPAAAATPPETPSDAAMRAAEEIEPHLDPYWFDRDRVSKIAAIITRHLAGTPSPERPVGGEPSNTVRVNVDTDDQGNIVFGNTAAPVQAAGDDEGRKFDGFQHSISCARWKRGQVYDRSIECNCVAALRSGAGEDS